MSIQLPQADMSLAVTVGPWVRQAGAGRGSLAQAVATARAMGFAAVQLDVTLPGVRPRELSQTGRRDLAALLRRAGMSLAGVDLFIPRKHFLDAGQVDRAVTAALAGITLAGEWGRVPVALALPVKGLGEDVKAALLAGAAGSGVRLAVHAEDQTPELLAWIAEASAPALGAGLDPAAARGAGGQPDKLVHQLAKHLTVARLSDAAADGLRCPVGAGELDVLSYRIAVQLAQGRIGPVVLDVRGTNDPQAAATAGKQAWEAQGM